MNTAGVNFCNSSGHNTECRGKGINSSRKPPRYWVCWILWALLYWEVVLLGCCSATMVCCCGGREWMLKAVDGYIALNNGLLLECCWNCPHLGKQWVFHHILDLCSRDDGKPLGNQDVGLLRSDFSVHLPWLYMALENMSQCGGIFNLQLTRTWVHKATYLYNTAFSYHSCSAVKRQRYWYSIKIQK